MIFIAGPYFADGSFDAIERNIRRAEETAIALANARIPFFCPHTHTAHFEVKAQAPESFYRALALEILRTCDAVLLLPGWETSRGTAGEIAEAKAPGIPIYESLEALLEAHDKSKIGAGCACERAARVPVDRIIAVFAEAVRTPEKDLRGRKRTEYLSQLRHLCVYLTYSLSGFGFVRLESFWKRDHSTLVHSCQVAQTLITKHPGMAEIVRAVHERLRLAG